MRSSKSILALSIGVAIVSQSSVLGSVVSVMWL